MPFSRIFLNRQTKLTYALRMDIFKPNVCYVNVRATVPKKPLGTCDCKQHCKYGPPPSLEMYNAEAAAFTMSFPTYNMDSTKV